jgi:D-3-phosphoglycerate dehydrogenase
MRILLASPICPRAIAALREAHEVIAAEGATAAELERLVAGADVIVLRSGVQFPAALLARAANLQLVIRAGSGLDNIDVDYLHTHGIVLARVPEPGAVAVAELTFALLLALARQVLVADRLLRQGRWAKHELCGRTLRGKTLGIVGAGSIGSRVGEMASAWGMKPVGCVERFTDAQARRLRACGIAPAPLGDVVEMADVVTIHCPYGTRTQHLIDERMIGRMRPGALYRALVDGRLGGAALDVHHREGEGHVSPLAGLPNVVLTPHIGASTVDAQREIGERVVDIVRRFTCGHRTACEVA